MIRRLAAIVLCALVLPSAAHAWAWPVDGPVLRPFSFDRTHPYAAGQHRGVDLGARAGTNVVAPASGVVSFAGTVPTGGKTLSIEAPSGYTATLVHLGSIGVQRGARVTEGAVVGTVGPSGVVDLAEPYVYFGLRTTGEDQGYVDPLTFLPPRPVVEPPASPAAAPDQPAATPAMSTPASVTAPAAEPVAAASAVPAAAEPAAPAAAPPVVPAADVRRSARPEEQRVPEQRSDGALAARTRPSTQAVRHNGRATANASRARHLPASARRQPLPVVPVAESHEARRASEPASPTRSTPWWTVAVAPVLVGTCIGLWRRRKQVDA